MWDKGVDYLTTYELLLRHIRRLKSPAKCYLMIALIQLRNGSRISEAVRCFKQWLLSGKHELHVEVSKKRKPEARLMIIPPEIHDIRNECLDLSTLDNKILRERVRWALYYYLRLNTHSLRYSYITYLLREGVNPAIVSKLIRHSRIDTLLHYVQTKASEDVLREYY
jgi:site-specific recombinase XerD